MGAVTSQASSEPWNIDICLNGRKPITFKIDTGADVSVLPYTLYREAMGTLSPPDKFLTSAIGLMPVVGKITTNVTIKGTTKLQNMYVVKNLKFPLLGHPTLTQFDLDELKLLKITPKCSQVWESYMNLITLHCVMMPNHSLSQCQGKYLCVISRC